MPFRKYLQRTADAVPADDADDDDNDARYTHPVEFQMPQFMYAGAPTLAPGGGAEVLPAAMFSPHGALTASSWFTNSGFTPRYVLPFALFYSAWL
jgi:hypothetical protein